jgi:hypothetical protein
MVSAAAQDSIIQEVVIERKKTADKAAQKIIIEG